MTQAALFGVPDGLCLISVFINLNDTHLFVVGVSTPEH